MNSISPFMNLRRGRLNRYILPGKAFSMTDLLPS